MTWVSWLQYPAVMHSFLLVCVCLQACDCECDSKFGSNWGHPGIDQINRHTATSKEHPVNCILGTLTVVAQAWEIHFPDILRWTSCPFCWGRQPAKTKALYSTGLFSCPSPVVGLWSRNVPIQSKKKGKIVILFSQTVSADRGEEHCVPTGGLVVGSYVRPAWQQSKAPLSVSYF